jgi:hypothetical protein
MIGYSDKKCSRCGDQAFFSHNGHYRCLMHYRFENMISRAKIDCKAVPSIEALEEMAALLVPFICRHCGEKMVWRRSESPARVVTLQHYNDGTMGLICMSCNSRHGAVGDDVFSKMIPSTKRCVGCGEVMSLESFVKCKTRFGGRGYRCYKCNRDLWAKDKDKYNALRRNRYAELAKERP